MLEQNRYLMGPTKRRLSHTLAEQWLPKRSSAALLNIDPIPVPQVESSTRSF
jgi:hypothetical protein